jgi:hypothetical protein
MLWCWWLWWWNHSSLSNNSAVLPVPAIQCNTSFLWLSSKLASKCEHTEMLPEWLNMYAPIHPPTPAWVHIVLLLMNKLYVGIWGHYVTIFSKYNSLNSDMSLSYTNWHHTVSKKLEIQFICSSVLKCTSFFLLYCLFI